MCRSSPDSPTATGDRYVDHCAFGDVISGAAKLYRPGGIGHTTAAASAATARGKDEQ
jgi:hypothetical protein